MSTIGSINPFGSSFSSSSSGTNATSGTNDSTQKSGSSVAPGVTSQSNVDLLVSNARLATSGARGALAVGGSGNSISVLGATLGDDGTSLFGTLPSQNSNIMNQIVQTAVKRFSELKQQIDDRAAQRNAAIDAQNQAWISVKAEVNNAQAAVSNGKDQIQTVQNELLGIRSAVADAAEDVKYNAGQFDDAFNRINNAAENNAQATNLVGSISPVDYSRNQIQYKNNVNGTLTTLNGTYIATDYRIVASDGSVWVPELGSDTLTHYSEVQGVEQNVTTAGITLPDSTSTRNGVKLLSYDPATSAISIAVTINPDDPPRTVTGTLQRTGIGLMQSWFYDGLTTQAGRDRANADIDAAESNLGLASGQLQTAANLTSTDSRKVDAQLSDLTQQTVKVNTDQLQQQQDLQNKSVQQLAALQSNMQQLQQMQQNYVSALAGAIDDPVGATLINIQL